MTPEDIKERYQAGRESDRTARETEAVRMLMTIIGHQPSLRAHVASQVLAGMVSNPTYSPHRGEGETSVEACARCACDYADALLAEIVRRDARETGGGQ